MFVLLNSGMGGEIRVWFIMQTSFFSPPDMVWWAHSEYWIAGAKCCENSSEE